jgi:hypothetical protein
MIHGTILGGLVTTPDLDAALSDYHGRLGLSIVERGILDADLAASWGCPASAGAAMAILQASSGAHCFTRLIEQPVPDGFAPTRTYGWAAYEYSVQDVYGWPNRLTDSGFAVVGPPREIAGLPYFVPMQVTGRGREMLYLNEVRSDTPASDLPMAACPVDRIFIVILAAPVRSIAVDWFKTKLGLEESGIYTLEYTMINHAFGLPVGTQSTISMVQKGRLPMIEVDEYPQAATVRPRAAHALPPGNALVTLAVDSLDALDMAWIAAPVARPEMPYACRRCATTIGPAGELLELVEIG